MIEKYLTEIKEHRYYNEKGEKKVDVVFVGDGTGDWAKYDKEGVKEEILHEYIAYLEQQKEMAEKLLNK